jgi:hypothetical protein
MPNLMHLSHICQRECCWDQTLTHAANLSATHFKKYFPHIVQLEKKSFQAFFWPKFFWRENKERAVSVSDGVKVTR